MKRIGWVLAVAACSSSPSPLPVSEPKPLAESHPAPAPDAAVVDAGPSAEEIAAAEAAKAQAEHAAAIEAAHMQCLDQSKTSGDDAAALFAGLAPGKPKATVFLAEAGDPKERYEHATFFEGPWNGESTRKKLATRTSSLTTCYAEALKRDPSIVGGVTLGAKLNEDGSLTDVRVIEQTVADQALQTCLQDRFGKLKIPGGSKDAFGFEAYFDLVLCPNDRVCLLGLDAPADMRDQLLVAANLQQPLLEACFKKTGKTKVRGLIDARLTIRENGGVRGSTHPVKPFAGDDKAGTAETAASDCLHDVWRRFCLEPPPIDGERSFHVRMWFQR